MKAKKLGALVLGTVMMVPAFTGCGSTASKGAASDSTAASTEQNTETNENGESKENGEKTKLTVSVWDNDTTPQFKSVTEAFMEKYPDVEVEFIDTQADEYGNKLTVMLAGGGSDPDVMFIKDTETQVSMKEKGQILNLDEYIKKDNVDLSIYGDVAELLKMDDSSYTLPFRKDYYMLYFNKKLFDDKGIAYPSADMTWDEYEELARQMTSGEGANKVYGTHDHTWMALVANWGVQDGKNTLMSDDYTFLKPYYEQALRMQDEGLMQSYANLKTGNIHYISVFEQGQAAMLPMGSWFIGTLIQDKNAGAFDFDWGVTAIPHPEGVAAGSTVGSTTPVAINTKSDTPDLAWEYIKFVTGEEGAKVLAENGLFPAVESEEVINSLANIEGFPEDGKAALETAGFVFDRPIDLKMASVRKVIEEEHDLIMIGEEDVDTGIQNMNTRAAEAKAE